jgi:hypothetical protein
MLAAVRPYAAIGINRLGRYFRTAILSVVLLSTQLPSNCANGCLGTLALRSLPMLAKLTLKVFPSLVRFVSASEAVCAIIRRLEPCVDLAMPLTGIHGDTFEIYVGLGQAF